MNAAETSNWFLQFTADWKPAIDFFEALLAPVIAIAIAYIAYHQHRTSKQRLQLRRWDLKRNLYSNALDILWGINWRVRVVIAAREQEEYEEAPINKYVAELEDLISRLHSVIATAGITFGVEAVNTITELSDAWDEITRTRNIGDKHKLLALASIAETSHKNLVCAAKRELLEDQT